MRDINSLTMSKMERAWTVNNSMVQEPQSTHKAIQRVVHILDAKYENQTSNQLLAPTVLT